MAVFYILALTLAVCAQYSHAGTTRIEAVGSGLDDTDARTLIKVDDDIVYAYNGEPSANGIVTATGVPIRGLHIAILEEDAGKYMLKEYKHYDTFRYSSAAQAAKDFITAQEDGTVIVGVSGDSYDRYLDGNFFNDVLGVDIASTRGVRSSLAFVAKKNDPDFVELDAEPRGDGPSELVVELVAADPTEPPTEPPTTTTTTTTTPEPTEPPTTTTTTTTTPEPTEPEAIDPCSLPKSGGDKKCNGKKVASADKVKMFYFDNGKCKAMKYTGCGGNENRFSSKKECKKSCL